MSYPTVSVIMPAYNHAEFVAQAIGSVLDQKHVNFELLVADDGSIDDTRERISKTNDKRLIFFQNESNRGACAVTNDLIMKSSGEFIALINSDDYWADENKLAYQVDFMRNNPGFGAIFGRARFINREGAALEKSSLSFGHIFEQENRHQGAWVRRFFDLGNCICHPTMLIRKKCYQEIGLYDNCLRQLPDFDMWVRLVKKYNIYISDKELVNFRILPGENASDDTTENSIRTINEHYLIAERFFDGVSPDLLISAFSDLLIIKELPSIEHFEIEKALLYFSYNQWLGKPYKMVGLLKLCALFNSPKHRAILATDYKINDRWFHKKMGEIDILRPKLFAELNQRKRGFSNAVQRIMRLF